jgi:hypothetical protein
MWKTNKLPSFIDRYIQGKRLTHPTLCTHPCQYYDYLGDKNKHVKSFANVQWNWTTHYVLNVTFKKMFGI